MPGGELLQHFANIVFQFLDLHPGLFFGVAVAHGYRAVFQALEIHGYAKWRTDFILAE
jgi:hypothetical protein